jgi:inorganic pyrophosphatase
MSRNIVRITFDSKTHALHIVIEAPKGRRTKFRYDEKLDLFQFDKVLPPGVTFPFDFGFIPSTLGGDGDPLDVAVLTDEPSFVGCLILGRLLGAIEAEQTQNGKTNRNDRLIAVPISTKSPEPQGTATELTDKVASDVRDFFVAYNAMQKKKFKPLSTLGPEEALRLVRRGMALASRKTHA